MATAAPALVGFLGSAAFEAIIGFLLLSGYSIGSSYADRRDGFYIRRAARIYPAYVGAIALALVAYGWPGAFVFFANLLFLNQLVTSQSFVGPAWSLALEVWLYALTPLLARASTRTIWCVAAASFIAYLVYVPSITLLHLPFFPGLGYGGIFLTLSCFWVLGFILATQPDQKRSCTIIAAVIAIHLATNATIQFGYSLKNGILSKFLAEDVPAFGWRIVILLLVWIALRLAISGHLPRRKSRILAWLGDLSYPLYVVHTPIFAIAAFYGVTGAGGVAALAFAGAAAVMIVFEYPVRRLRSVQRPSAIVG